MSTARIGKYEARVKNEKATLGAENGKNGTVPLWVAASHRVWRTESRLCVPLRAMSAPHRCNYAFRRYLLEKPGADRGREQYARDADSGNEVRFHFCPNCGSNIYYEFDRSPDECGIPVGNFADPDFVSPTYSAYEESMHHWVRLPSGIDHFPKARPVTSR